MANGSLLGAKLPDAQKQVDLFTWFFFTKVDEPPSDGAQNATVFRPNGPAFHNLVKLELEIAADETITKASLHIERAFIENPSQCVFAADLAKSFVRYADAPSVDELAQEINARTMARSSQPIILRGSAPSVSGKPSAAYRVYAGEASRQSLGNMALENRTIGDKRVFVITIGGTKPPQGWFSRLIQRAR
jgi:hypothetical protein